MKLGRLQFNVWAVALFANVWLCQTALAADAPPHKHEAEVIMAQKVTALVQSQLKEQTATLEARQGELEKRVLEAERKSIDWWFAWLAIFTTLIGVGGALIPYLLGRKDKELLALEIEAVQRARKDVERLLQETASDREKTQVHQNQSRDALAQTQKNLEASKQILQNTRSSSTETEEQKHQQQAAAQQVLASPDTTPIDKLRAQAVQAEASQDAELATVLWRRVQDLSPMDANAAFNYAYWLQQKTQKSVKSTGQDYRLVSEAYAQAEQLDQDIAKNHLIPNNWAVALDDEARATFSQDLDAARALWQQAGEKYALALEITREDHDVANNWGVALAAEAKALKDQDLAGARALWKQAGEKYALALEIKRDKHEAADNWGVALLLEAQAIKASAPDEAKALLAQAQNLFERHRDMNDAGAKRVAYNLACVYALQNHAGPAVAQLEVYRLSGALVTTSNHWRTDPDLDPIRQSPEYQTWLQKNFPNE